MDYVGVDGEFKLLSMFDRYVSDDRDSAINYSDISVSPSKSIDLYYENFNSKVISMFKKLGFKDGLIFLQGYSNGDKITFYEMGCRLGGSFFNLESELLNLNPVEMIIRYAFTGKMLSTINEISDYSAKFSKIGYVCNYLLDIDLEGEIISEIRGIEEIIKLPSYVNVIKHRDIGYTILKDKIIDKPVLTFFMIDDSIEDAKNTIGIMNEKIKVTNEFNESLLTKEFDYNELI